MKKSRFAVIILAFFIIPVICQASDIDDIKVDFLQGNYRRVIFEGQAQINQLNGIDSDELNYILGLSYLKESKLKNAQNCFKLVLAGSSNKLKKQAELGLADAYLTAGRFQEAGAIYKKMITDNPGAQEAAVLYRLSQLEFKKGNNQLGNDYLSKLRRDFPLSPELRLNRGLAIIDTPIVSEKDTGEYSVQVGFFASSNNANNLKNKLLYGNYPAYVENTGAGYRVRVGRFKNQNEALNLESKLSQEGFQTKICP